MTTSVDVRDGAVYLPAAVYETYFRDVEAVILLIREGDLQVLPVRQMAAGGCLLKVRNAAGDRVAVAPDVFQANGLENWRGEGLTARWSSDRGALIVQVPQKSAN